MRNATNTPAAAPARGEVVSVTVTEPFTYQSVQVTGPVAYFIDRFEDRIGYVVRTYEYGDVHVWLV